MPLCFTRRCFHFLDLCLLYRLLSRFCSSFTPLSRQVPSYDFQNLIVFLYFLAIIHTPLLYTKMFSFTHPQSIVFLYKSKNRIPALKAHLNRNQGMAFVDRFKMVNINVCLNDIFPTSRTIISLHHSYPFLHTYNMQLFGVLNYLA